MTFGIKFFFLVFSVEFVVLAELKVVHEGGIPLTKVSLNR